MHAVYNLSTLCKHIWLDFYIVGQSVFSPGHSQLSLFIRLLLFFLAWMCVWCELCEYVRVLPASPAFSITSIYYTGVIRLLCSWSKSTQSTLLLYLLPLMDFICVSLFSNSPCVEENLIKSNVCLLAFCGAFNHIHECFGPSLELNVKQNHSQHPQTSSVDRVCEIWRETRDYSASLSFFCQSIISFLFSLWKFLVQGLQLIKLELALKPPFSPQMRGTVISFYGNSENTMNNTNIF